MWKELQAGDPQQVGPYRLRALLGVGGMGRVFLGASADGSLAAVKVIRSDLATDPEFRARFGREVTVARKVSGPFTAPLIDADVDGPVPWLATAYVTGPSLADAVAENGPLPVPALLKLAAGLAEGLSAIHAAGVVHRDLKPSNVLLAQDGPRVIDFGISVAAETSPLTRTGLVVGSPGYMSPEQAEGSEVGPPSDIFSLGAVLVFAATGRGPFGTGSAPTLAYRAVYREPGLDGVPAAVRGLIERCLAKDPAQRPAAQALPAQAGGAEPAAGWPPDPVTRTVLDLPAAAEPSPTVTSARATPEPAAMPRPAAMPGPGVAAPGTARAQAGKHSAGRQRRRAARPLVVASMVAGLLAASAAGGIALAASAHQTPGMHSGQAVSGHVTSPATPIPATSAPSTSAPSTAGPSASASTAGAQSTSAPANGSATPTAAPSVSPAGTQGTTSPDPAASPAGGPAPGGDGPAAPATAASPAG